MSVMTMPYLHVQNSVCSLIHTEIQNSQQNRARLLTQQNENEAVARVSKAPCVRRTPAPVSNDVVLGTTILHFDTMGYRSLKLQQKMQ